MNNNINNNNNNSTKGRVQLTIEKKKIILDHLSKGESYRKIAKRFGVTASTIFKINQKRIKIMETWQKNPFSKRQRLTMGQYDVLNEKTFQFFRLCRAKGMPLNGPLIQEKAKEIARDLNIRNFSASPGWLERFRKKHNISFKKIKQEANGIHDDNSIPDDWRVNNEHENETSDDWKTEDTITDNNATDDWKTKIPNIICEYRMEDIFNADETAISYRHSNGKSSMDDCDSTNGINKCKERVTVLFCCNAQGEKLKPVVVGKVAYPKAFKAYHIKTEDLPIIWRHNKKAWMTSAIFTEWLTLINSEMRAVDRKILIFVDDAPSHSDVELSHVKLVILPSHLTSEVQPLNHGILQAIKLNYRKKVLRTLIHSMNICKNASEFANNFSLVDAIEWLVDSWQSIPLNTIITSFANAGFSIGDMEYLPERSPQSEVDDYVQELELFGLKDVDLVSSADDDLEIHESVNYNSTESNRNPPINTEITFDDEEFLINVGDEDAEPIISLETVMEYCMECRKYAYATNNQDMIQLLYELKKKIEEALWQKQINRQ